MKRAALALAILSLACGPELLRLYDGPPRPAGETTRIRLDVPAPEDASFWVDFGSCEEVLVGSRESPTETIRPGTKAIELLPRHIYRCSVRCMDVRTGESETDPFDVGFEGEAGREYAAVASYEPGQRCRVRFEELTSSRR